MSHLTLRNNTSFIAQFVVFNGPHVITHIRNIEPNVKMVVPATSTYQVTARVMIMFYVYAVINGITTETAVTTNPNAVIAATTDTSTLGSGYFALDVGWRWANAVRSLG